jgi:release factor glutamine methyltransferase
VRSARTNVRKLKLSNRVEIVQSDLFTNLGGRGLAGTIDVIVCNPPCISSAKLASECAELLIYEPRSAFDGGPSGVSILQRVVCDAPVFLKPGGTLLFEIGLGQECQVALLFERTGCYDPVATVNDREGRPRVIAGRARRRD